MPTPPTRGTAGRPTAAPARPPIIPDPELLEITVHLGSKVYKESLATQSQVATDIEGLNRALSEHPGRFAWWATLEVLARAQEEQLGEELKRLEADLFAKHSTRLTNEAIVAASRVEGGAGKMKPPTLDAINNSVLLDPARTALSGRVAQARKDAGLCHVGRRTMEQRRDSLMTIAANTRAEMESNLTVRRRAVHELYEGQGQRG